MSMHRKPRSDAKLKTLTAERQDGIAEYAAGHSLAETCAWLGHDGLKTSSAALSEFLSWYALKWQLAKNESTVESVLEELKTSRPDFTDAQLFAAGQSFFSKLAIQRADPKGWKYTQDLRFKREELNLEREKFQRDTCAKFLQWAEDQRAKEIAGSGQTNSEKIEKLGSLMFGEDWK